MKSIYFFVATFLCLLIIITYGNGNPVAQQNPPKAGDGADAVNNEQKQSPEPSSKPMSTKSSNDTYNHDNTLSSLADPATMKRMLYVLLGFTTLVVAFFAFKTIRQRTRRKTKKYGVLATPASDVELTPLDQEDDDEDMTVFDANSK